MDISATGLTLLLGGARSGKSDLATQLGEAWSSSTPRRPVTFVATAEALDDDMAQRIDRHRDDRPADWSVVETPRFDATDAAALSPGHLVIVDCITMLTANLMLAELGEPAILDHIGALGAELSARPSPTIVISNEVGMGVHPPTELGREYQDLLGRANRTLATAAHAAFLIVAGRALELHPVRLPDSSAT